ncbi:MAG TPA: AAA family ATPase [Gaiellaceae bacterium]|nr:AAA family ATPase [Gaiellaceae bacterium]
MFVGRELELAHLMEVLESAARGAVRAAFVIGEPGSGKTRLLAEARTMAPSEGQFGVVGYEAEQSVPLGAAAPLLRALGDATGGSLLPRAAETSALEPVRVFEAAHRALRECAAVAVFMDDVQWTDELSRALVHYVLVGARAEQRPLALVAASRPDATATAFADSVARALPSEGVTVLQLGPLSRDDGVQLAMSLDGDLDESRAAALWQRSGGVPFWLETLARDEGRGADVEQAVTYRLRRLGDDAVSALAVLVVASRPLTPTALAEIQRWSPARTAEAIRELVAAGVATQGQALVQPVHDLLREEAFTRLPDEVRRDVHQRLAAFLARLDDLQSQREAVEHRMRAGLPLLDLLERLVTHPQRRLLGRDGLMDLYTAAGGAGGERSLALDTGLAALAVELGDHSLAEELWSAVAESADAPREAARAALEASRAAYRADRIDAASRLLTRARALCDDEALEIEIDAHEGGVRRWLAHDVEGGELLTARALNAADALVERAGGLRGLERSALEAVHEARSAGVDAALVADDPERGLALASELVDVAARLGDERRLLALLKRAQMFFHSGRALEGADDEYAAWSAARERVLPMIEIEAGFTRAGSLLRLGRLQEAERLGAETAALAARSAELGRMSSTPWRIQRTPLLIQLSRGDWQSAVDELRAAAAAEPDPHRRLHVDLMIGVWLARVDSVQSRDEVALRFATAQGDADAARCPRCRSDVDLRAGESLARVGLVEEARAAVQGWDVRHPSPGAVSRFWRLRTEASLAAAVSDFERARRLLEGLSESAADFRFELERVWIELDLASALAEIDRANAVRVLRTAVDRAERIGANTQRAVAVQRLRALGVRTWRRGSAGELLTDRESQIAELVATGASNPEIAQALFLSRKTVERHVSNILRKFGVRNRAELAARLGDRDRKAEGAPR